MLKVLERGKFSGITSCYHLSAYWYPHPLLQLLLEVGRVSVPQSTGELGHHLAWSFWDFHVRLEQYQWVVLRCPGLR